MGLNDLGRIDEVIHGRMRLGIMVYLADVEAADFTELKTVLEATQGNLSVHLKKLEEAGYVAISKSFVNNKPLTRAAITLEGRKAFDAYLEVHADGAEGEPLASDDDGLGEPHYQWQIGNATDGWTNIGTDAATLAITNAMVIARPTSRASTPITRTEASWRARCWASLCTPACSAALSTSPLRPPWPMAPRKAMWLASVAPLVNTTSVGWQPRKRATLARASCRQPRAACPASWGDDGLAQ